MKKKYVIWFVCLVCIIGVIIFLYAGKDATKNKNENSETFDSVFEDTNSEEDEDSSTNGVGDKTEADGNEEVRGDNETSNKADDGKDNSEEGGDINDQKGADSGITNDESPTEKFSVDEDTETKYGPIY